MGSIYFAAKESILKNSDLKFENSDLKLEG